MAATLKKLDQAHKLLAPMCSRAGDPPLSGEGRGPSERIDIDLANKADWFFWRYRPLGKNTRPSGRRTPRFSSRPSSLEYLEENPNQNRCIRPMLWLAPSIAGLDRIWLGFAQRHCRLLRRGPMKRPSNAKTLANPKQTPLPAGSRRRGHGYSRGSTARVFFAVDRGVRSGVSAISMCFDEIAELREFSQAKPEA